MNRVIFPLSYEMQSSEVADLQDALLLFLERGIIGADDEAYRRDLTENLQPERSKQFYGEVTTKIVGIFQSEQQLQVESEGSVDEPTAKAINALLEELGEDLEEPCSTDQQRIVAGQILESGQPFVEGMVRAFHLYEKRLLRLGEDAPDANGQYTIRYSPLPGVKSINLQVTVFDAKGRALGESEPIPDAGPLEFVDLEVSRRVDATNFQVEGKVASRVSAGMEGLNVQIVDKTVGQDVVLANAITNERGEYRATFTDTNLRRRGKTQPDLQARVLQGQSFLAISEVHYNATTREVLDVLVDDKAVTALQSEYSTLTSALRTQFRGNLGSLQETDDRQDITYLANKTGWDARAVALAALADQFSGRAGTNGNTIEPDFFYALFRAGISANETSLYQTDASTVGSVWQKAIDQGVIPATLKDRIPQAQQQFQALAATRLLDNPAIAGVSSLKEMLSISLGDESGRQQQFAQLYTQFQGDSSRFWTEVRTTFGEPVEQRLRIDGQLGYLTINNAPLIRKLHDAVGQNGLPNLNRLVEQGYFRAEAWQSIIGDTPVPSEVPGKDTAEKRVNYSELMAAQVRISFPTAVVAEMVRSGETPLVNGAREEVSSFLTQQQGIFEIGMQPIEQYIARNNLQVAPEVTLEIERIQRIRQVTPNDRVMNTLLGNQLDSAYAIVNRYDKDEFVQAFKDDLGGEEVAELTYAKSQQVHNVVLNLATSYLTTNRAPGIGLEGQFLNPNTLTAEERDGTADDVIAYPTLENLLGEMDYCTCEHCRSILSPAAYLVDLLLFCDRPVNERENPQAVLLERRPDIQHLPLTCENTNTPLPYIDLVNETLEYYVTNGLSLGDTNPDPNINNEYKGHSTEDDVTSEELLATPQFVSDTAYTTLANTLFPAPLPFHQPLENLRRYFDRFEISLSHAMEVLRKNDAIDRASPNDYGWRDILMEELHLSRAEYALLSDRTIALQQLYGFDPTTEIAVVLNTLANAKTFARRIAISYEDLIEVLRTRFINPNSYLIPKLERLGVPFSTLKNFKDGTITDAQFDALLNPGVDATQYGGDIKAWVKNDANYANIMGLIVLTNPSAAGDLCSFDRLEFRYANPDNATNQIRVFEYVRLIRFIRLWKKLGWTINQTDKAVTALYPETQTPNDADDEVNFQRLDMGFLTLLPRLGCIKQVMRLLNLNLKKDLPSLLACFTTINTHGMTSLYRQMFLRPALLKQDNAFSEDEYGNFLQKFEVSYNHAQPTLEQSILDASDNQIAYDDAKKSLSYQGVLTTATRDALKEVASVTTAFQAAINQLYAAQRLFAHTEALRAAFNLTNEEFSAITTSLNFNAETSLTLDNLSSIFRRGWLARKLKLSVREFLLLTQVTGFDPFVAPDPANPPILQLIKLVNRLRQVGLKPVQALYLIWNQDISGKSVPPETEILGFARSLRASFAAIKSEFALTSDPDGQIARSRMALVYGNEATDFFFGLLGNTLTTVVPYSHEQATLEQPILDVTPGLLTYDDFRKQLTFAGVLNPRVYDALKDVAGVTGQFQAAIDSLYTANQQLINPFFERYPELRPLYDAFAASTEPVEKKRSDLLANFLPELKRRRKQQQVIQAISAAAKVDVSFASSLLNDAIVLHAIQDNTQPALSDLIASGTRGLAAQFFFRDTATGTVDLTRDAEANLNYAAIRDNPLPANPVPADAISGIWNGYLEAPENGFYNLLIEADTGATVTVALAGVLIPLTQNGMRWSNSTPINLQAGTLYAINLKAETVRNTLNVRWQTTGRGWEVIPSDYLYSATLTDHLRTAHIRFLKVTSLATALKLTANEIAYLASQTDYHISSQGWLNSLTVTGNPDNATSTALLKAFHALLDLARIKAELVPDDERLLTLLKDPATPIQKDLTTATPNPNNVPFSLLFSLTRWESNSLNELLTRFGKNIGDLSQVETFDRIYNAYQIVKEIGIPATALIPATTNEPTGTTVRDFQSALRARYDESTWLQVLKPLNDEMRKLQRDALVAYILHQMRSNPATAHVDTPDKLFEYFLMDVQMEPCMQTSRIRHALSSVQLFIERCLMNLEPRVAPSSFKSKERKQWEWMKRYRVWEANRKVFLYPENWLEPELRDDQSPFFKETMSELLQGDITEDRAAEALLNYLTKLEEVAKLEPCGIHYVEDDPSTKAKDDIAHVVARTTGASRKYFYRRREYGYWTPWEQIRLDIEDNPVLPVVWNNRLFLFWLRILKQAPLQVPSLPSGALADVSASATVSQTPTKVTIQAVLCWSEYFNSKWQAVRTSDITQPLGLGQHDMSGANAFDRSKLQLSAFFWTGGTLRIIVSNEIGAGASFFLYNVHSSPELRNEKKKNRHFAPKRMLDTATDALKINYPSSNISQSVLKNGIGDRTIEPHQPLSGNPWDIPFFYEDSRHVFYVTTAERIIQIPQWNSFGIVISPPQWQLDIPPLVLEPVKVIPDFISPIIKQPGFGVVNPSPIERYVTEDAYIYRGIGSPGTVSFGGKEIGLAGSQIKSIRTR